MAKGNPRGLVERRASAVLRALKMLRRSGEAAHGMTEAEKVELFETLGEATLSTRQAFHVQSEFKFGGAGSAAP